MRSGRNAGIYAWFWVGDKKTVSTSSKGNIGGRRSDQLFLSENTPWSDQGVIFCLENTPWSDSKTDVTYVRPLKRNESRRPL